MQDCANENKIHQQVATNVLESLEAKVSSLDTTMNKLLMELTAVRGTFETHKAELARTVSDTKLKAALSISKEFHNYFFTT